MHCSSLQFQCSWDDGSAPFCCVQCVGDSGGLPKSLACYVTPKSSQSSVASLMVQYSTIRTSQPRHLTRLKLAYALGRWFKLPPLCSVCWRLRRPSQVLSLTCLCMYVLALIDRRGKPFISVRLSHAKVHVSRQYADGPIFQQTDLRTTSLTRLKSPYAL